MKKAKEAYEALVTMVRTVIISRIKSDAATESKAEIARDEALENLKTAIEDDVMEALEAATLVPREVPMVAEVRSEPFTGGNSSSIGRAGGVKRRAAPVTKPKKSKRASGEKRSQDQIEAVADKLEILIRKSPGLRMEEIGKRLGLATKDLALPARKLIADKAVKTKGQKRATTYWAR